MMPRDEGQALDGLLFIRIGGNVKEMPTLKIKQSRKWKAEVGEVLNSITSRIPDNPEKNVDILRPLVNLPADVMLDLVLSYDVTNVLSGERTAAANRKWVEDNADDREVFAALQQMLTATFPFGSVLRSVVGASGDELRQIAMGYLRRLNEKRQQPEVSTNGHSATGALTLMESTADSATSST